MPPPPPQGISSLDPIAEVVGWKNKQFPAGAGELSVTRTDPISKERLSYCELVAHCRTTGRRRNAANRMQSIRGKQQKRRWRKLVSIHAFFLFSLRPWVRISVPQASRGNSLFSHTTTSRIGSRADGPGVGVQGARSPLLRPAKARPTVPVFARIWRFFPLAVSGAKRGEIHAKNKQKSRHIIRRNPSQNGAFVL